jgi:anaphase-promoting complex subunit 3
VERYLHNKVWQYLDAGLYSTARFTAERLFAFDSINNDYRNLIALVYLRMGEVYTALNYAKDTRHLGCLFVYGQCCLVLKKYQLGIAALENGDFLYKNNTTGEEDPIEIPWPGQQDNNNSVIARVVIPHTSMVLALLGTLYKAAGMDKRAIITFALAIKLDPFCWEAVAGLCELQVEINPDKLYKDKACMFNFSEEDDDDNDDEGLMEGRKKVVLQNSFSAKLALDTGNINDKDLLTTSPGFDHFSKVNYKPIEGSETPETPKSSNQCSNRNKSFSHQLPSYFDTKKLNKDELFVFPQRRSPGLNQSTKKKPLVKRHAVKKKLHNPNQLVVASYQQASKVLAQLYSTLTASYIHYCHYRCDECIATLHHLSPAQFDTPWVIARLARMYFEKVEYPAAREWFTRLRQLQPYRIEDMEYYSTVLWHLRDAPALTYLANALVAQDRAAPQTWCSVGNALSLAHETDAAIRAFRRASALWGPNGGSSCSSDAAAAYAHALEAHEHVTADAYEHAQACYRRALRLDKRHYNAWYGLGVVFLRLGDMAMAKLHFVTANRITPANSVVSCCIGVVEEHLGQLDRALACYSNAIGKHPKSAISRYKRARLLIKMQRYSEAMNDLECLSELAPDEAAVHFLKGQILKMMNKRAQAVHELTVALTLDPKGAHLIKKALEDLRTFNDNY